MSEPEAGLTPQPAQPAPVAPRPPAPPAPSQHASSFFAEPPAYFAEALAEAEMLLQYTAESGIEVDPSVRDTVLRARILSGSAWDEATAAALLAALTSLVSLVRLRTARRLKARSTRTAPTVKTCLIMAVCLAVLIVPFSIASFVASAISAALRADIAAANDLAVKLNTQTRPSRPEGDAAASSAPLAAMADPASTTLKGSPTSEPCSAHLASSPPLPLPQGISQSDVVAELSQYASLIRSIDARARQLNLLVLNAERDPCEAIRKKPVELHRVFQLPPGLPNLAQAADDRTTVYQDVRYFAQSLLDDVSFLYGAITTCLLPVLYALLGTCAYLLRSFEKPATGTQSYLSNSIPARFLIAGIGGAVVGLFNNFTITQGASIPPLAIAFLVGYAVDVFFAFLEGMLQAFTKGGSQSSNKSDLMKGA